jgi:two-component system sensor histidine kinase YesM
VKSNLSSLPVQLSMYFTLLVLTPLFLVIFISYISFARDIETNTKETIGQFSAYTVEAMERMYDRLSLLAMEIVDDKMLWTKLNEKEEMSSGNAFELRKLDQDIEQIFTNYTSKIDGIINIGVMLPNGNVYSSNLRLTETVFEQTDQHIAVSVWLQDFISQGRTKELYRLYNGQIIFVNKLHDVNDFNNTAGYLLCEMDAKLFGNMFTGRVHENRSSIYIINDRGKIIYQRGEPVDYSNLSGIGSNMQMEVDLGQENYLLESRHSSLTGWSFIELIPYKVIIQNADRLRNTSIGLVLVCYILSLLVTVLLSRKLVLPLRKIMSKMKDVGNWDETQLEVNGPVEVRDIVTRFNFMREEIRHLIDDIKEEQRKAKEADMAVLQAQLNPHFLYNTLNLITFLSRKGKNEEIQVLTGSLISFLQNSLKSGALLVSLPTEIRMIEHYFLLHQFRMEGQIQMYISVDHNLLAVKIPRFILQPIVENAIFHGLYPKQDVGSIILSVVESGNDMVISIIDDGVGIHQQPASKVRSGVGLHNVIQRLKHIYPDGGTDVVFCSKPGVGTSVIITIPKNSQTG